MSLEPDVSGRVPAVATVHAGLIRVLLADGEDGTWAVYARGWMDGSLQAGTLRDPVFERPATVRDFVRDAQAGTASAARGSVDGAYVRARGLEDVAWAAEFIALDKPEKARAFVVSACRRLGIPFSRVMP